MNIRLQDRFGGFPYDLKLTDDSSRRLRITEETFGISIADEITYQCDVLMDHAT